MAVPLADTGVRSGLPSNSERSQTVNRTLVAVAFVSGLMVLPSVAQAQRATVIKERGQAAGATFARIDDSGCFETDIVVLGTLAMTKQAPGHVDVTVPYAQLNITVIN